MKIKNRNLTFSFILIAVIFSLILIEKNVVFTASEDIQKNSELSLDSILDLLENSIERYAYSQALANNTSYEYELQKEKDFIANRISPRIGDEYIAYRIVSGKAKETIKTNSGNIGVTFYTEIRCVVNRRTGRVSNVESWGKPYVTTNDYYKNFQGSDVNINRTGNTSARFSVTGQFYINGGSFSIGGDIIGYSVDLGYVTVVKTYSTQINVY
ncbi:MAG: hypothetical protein WAO56_01975 [Miniphocaeibacter sp.]|uniref:hypothetical protein n=1 Tax=Miniphocaeibacter sp. TaxID=3100973 RepID=UPI00184AF69A|nr:hypothetical protein [Gallicola sp.]